MKINRGRDSNKKIKRSEVIKKGLGISAAAIALRTINLKSEPIKQELNPNDNQEPSGLQPHAEMKYPPGEFQIGKLSKRKFFVPNPNAPPMPDISTKGFNSNGQNVRINYPFDSKIGYPDVLSYRKKFGLLIPATNTSMESELWKIIHSNIGKLKGIGIHISNVFTPKPQLKNSEDLRIYKENFLKGLADAVDKSILAQPEYLIMGMSLEHILFGLEYVKRPVTELEKKFPIGIGTWHNSIQLALKKFRAKRIGILTPFDSEGNANARRMFEDLGFEVVVDFGFSCANALHIAHIPDEAKEIVIQEILAKKENRIDAIVQCGTNMSLLNVSEKMEPRLGIPILGINTVLFWYALRENGINEKLVKASRIFSEF
ncbi:maleate cis-trans isomerase family protein [Leptospira sp. GIMC2001]|uniref:maleate cis-trans isomerase family protein n=1 Tax=Leptospira sp. GIMC2001 TaxID=1513297 RepID=UPI00234AD905|nr:hypothetical protein [Leptospira sp. GIMC2001]WCL48465.1 hypothetical protein O4O04_14290 [Leptospira sp. GIMC2001]